MEGRLGETGAHPMKPEIAAGLAKNGLVVVADLPPADPARVDGRRRWVLGVENHRLAGRVDPLVGRGRHGTESHVRMRRWTGRDVENHSLVNAWRADAAWAVMADVCGAKSTAEGSYRCTGPTALG